jgi:Glycosyl transferase family 2
MVSRPQKSLAILSSAIVRDPGKFYNASANLAAILMSQVFERGRAKFESTDDTARVVEAYARKDSRIRLIEHDERKGAQAARNTGILAPAGKWIAFLDSDDEWLHDSLALRLQLAEKGRLPLVILNVMLLNKEARNCDDSDSLPCRSGFTKLCSGNLAPCFQVCWF